MERIRESILRGAIARFGRGEQRDKAILNFLLTIKLIMFGKEDGHV